MDCAAILSVVFTILFCIAAVIGIVQLFIFEFHWFYHKLLKLKNKIKDEKNKN